MCIRDRRSSVALPRPYSGSAFQLFTWGKVRPTQLSTFFKKTVLSGFVRAKIEPKKQNQPPISHVKPRTVLYTVSFLVTKEALTSVIDAKVNQQRSYFRIARVQESTHRDSKSRVNRRIQEHPIKLWVEAIVLLCFVPKSSQNLHTPAR